MGVDTIGFPEQKVSSILWLHRANFFLLDTISGFLPSLGGGGSGTDYSSRVYDPDMRKYPVFFLREKVPSKHFKNVIRFFLQKS